MRSSGGARVIVLGPQRLRPTLDRAIADLGFGPGQRFATVTAGWEEREPDDQELHEHLWKRTVNLRLFERSEAVLRAEPELAAAVRWRAERLRELQELYRVRLVHALAAAHELARREPKPHGHDLLEAERAAALEGLRTLDREHEERAAALRAEFEARARPIERAHLLRHRSELSAIVADCAALCVAGGHVAVLLEALRLFDFPALVGGRPLVCWSAGAMALSERVVLFHEDPPQGAGSSELLEAGLGLVPRLLPLPHAHRRLRLSDPERMALIARRFRPLVCTPLIEGDRVDWDGRRWRLPRGPDAPGQGTQRVTEQGLLLGIEP
jgi:hypothetical protein